MLLGHIKRMKPTLPIIRLTKIFIEFYENRGKAKTGTIIKFIPAIKEGLDDTAGVTQSSPDITDRKTIKQVL